MDSGETALPGSRLNRVVRVGDTVRRPAGPWTPTVHALLRHVRSRGFEYAPEPLGIDGEGREVLSYLAGRTVGADVPWPSWVWSDDLLCEMGRVGAAYHRAVADFRPGGLVAWQFGPAVLGASQIVCHHDMAPYNAVVGDAGLSGIIDWDLAGPGTPVSDLAFVAWQWVPLQHPAVARFFGWSDPGALGRRLRLLLDSYGLDQRAGFIDEVVARIRYNRDGMLRRAAEGADAYIRLVGEGHVEGMDAAASFVLAHRDDLQAQID